MVPLGETSASSLPYNHTPVRRRGYPHELVQDIANRSYKVNFTSCRKVDKRVPAMRSADPRG